MFGWDGMEGRMDTLFHRYTTTMTRTAWPVHIIENLFFDKTIQGKSAFIEHSLLFNLMIYLMKTIPHHREMTWLPFQKLNHRFDSMYAFNLKR